MTAHDLDPAADQGSALGAADGAIDRLERVKATVAVACRAAGRDPGEVTLVAASKTVPGSVLRDVVNAGHYCFGENRVQEAARKWPDLEERDRCELRLIGPLQTNKVREAVRLFDHIESVDRPRLCSALSQEQDKQGRRIPIYIQVNLGEEDQKAGSAPADTDSLIELARGALQLDVRGVMGIPPARVDPRPYFDLLAGVAERHALDEISMGMSSDFAEAIAAGATHVRVGSAIFGARPTAPDTALGGRDASR